MIATTILLEIARLASKTSLLPHPIVGLCCNRPWSVSSRLAWSKPPDLPLKLSSHLSVQEIAVLPVPFPVVKHCRNHLATLHFSRSRHGRKPRTCRWNFDAIYYSSSGITISGFGSHIAISGCRSTL